MTDQTTPLRDRIAAAVEDCRTLTPAALADAVLAVLPATTNHDTDTSTECAECRERAAVDIDDLRRSRYRCLRRAEKAEAEVQRLSADRVAVLREAADRIDNEELPPDYVDMFDNGARWATRLLRRVADETAATETQTLCGKDRGVSGLYYRPCSRPAGHAEAYCKSADGSHLFLAGQPDIETQAHVCKPAAIAYYCPTSGETESNCHGGFDACCDRPDLHQPAAGARQDGAQQ